MKDTFAAQQNQVLICYICMERYCDITGAAGIASPARDRTGKQQKGQGPTCQGPQEFLFPEFRGSYQVGKSQVAQVERDLI